MQPSLLTDAQAQFLRDEKEALAGFQLELAEFDLPREALDSLQKAILQLDELFLLVVAGEFNAGKSALINALLGQKVLAEGATPTTTRVTLVKWGEQAAEQVHELVLQRRVGLHRREAVIGHRGELVVHHQAEQIALVGGVEEQRARRDVGALGHRPRRRVVVADPGEQLPAGALDALALVEPVLLAPTEAPGSGSFLHASRQACGSRQRGSTRLDTIMTVLIIELGHFLEAS